MAQIPYFVLCYWDIETPKIRRRLPTEVISPYTISGSTYVTQPVERSESGSWVGGYGTYLVLEGVPAFPLLVQRPP
jgi:hypothetical protein